MNGLVYPYSACHGATRLGRRTNEKSPPLLGDGDWAFLIKPQQSVGNDVFALVADPGESR